MRSRVVQRPAQGRSADGAGAGTAERTEPDDLAEAGALVRAVGQARWQPCGVCLLDWQSALPCSMSPPCSSPTRHCWSCMPCFRCCVCAAVSTCTGECRLWADLGTLCRRFAVQVGASSSAAAMHAMMACSTPAIPRLSMCSHTACGLGAQRCWTSSQCLALSLDAGDSYAAALLCASSHTH